MITKLGEKFTHLFLKYMPDAFVFAILLTFLAGLSSYFWMDAKPLDIIVAWYDGFFDLLSFTMQIVLIIITGYSIALSPAVNKGIDKLNTYIKTPNQVYFFVVLIGLLFSLVSFGWVVITCVFARALAQRVKGINYPFLIACVYFSFNSWVFGLSSTIPLLLNTEKNYLVEANILQSTIDTSLTLGSSLNVAMIAVFLLLAPLLLFVLRPRSSKNRELKDLLKQTEEDDRLTIKQEALSLKLPFKAWSDNLNNSRFLQYLIVLMGMIYIVYHFYTKGLDINFNIMIFVFLIVGLFLHETPMRYVISMKRSSRNISGILFQYPIYAGIMGIMLYSGLGERLGELLASVATIDSYPYFAYMSGGLVNFAIPSAGGEFAVIGPSIINAVQEIGAGLPPEQVEAMISRASISVAYGESLSNMLQPFFLLIVMPIMGKGVNLQARDIMGYLVIPFLVFFVLQVCLVLWMPL